MTTPVILVEAQPRRAADGVAETVRLAGLGGSVPYYYDGQHWKAGIKGLPTITTSLSFEGDDLGTGGVPSVTAIEWAPATNAALAAMEAYVWTAAPVTIRVGPEGALPPVAISGKVMEATAADGVLRIVLADAAAALKVPLLTARFAGTGGLEGPADWEGTIKRRVWGRVWNQRGEPIDKANCIYCFADPTKPIQSFDAVRDRGAPAAALTFLAWQGTAEATFAALQVAVAPQGGGVVAPSIACVKWWTTPAGDLTADLKGEIGSGYVETLPQIAERLVEEIGGPAFAAGTVAGAAAARPAPAGWTASSDSTTVAAMLDELLGGVSLLWLLDSAGQIVIRQWTWGASVVSVRAIDVSRKRAFRPLATRKIGYRRNELPMARGDLAGIVLATEVAYLDGTPIEDLKPAEAGATSGAPSGTNVGDKPVDTLLLELAQLELATSQALFDIAAIEAEAAAIAADMAAAMADLAAQGADILALEADILAAGGQIAAINTTLGTQGASISTLQTTVDNHTGTLASHATEISTANANIAANATAISTAQGDISALKLQVTAGGGNLLTNTDFAIDTSGWAVSVNGQTGILSGRNLNASGRQPNGENVIGLGQPNTTATGYSQWTQYVAVKADDWLDVSVLAVAARCQVQVYIEWFNASDVSGGSSTSGAITPNLTGAAMADWTPISFKAQVPAGMVRGRLILRKWGTLAAPDSYAWFLRPQVAKTLATSATPLAYSAGSARASVEAQATAISTLSGTLATLSTTVGTQGTSISSLQSAMTTVQGDVATHTTQINTANANISTNATAISTLQGSVSTLSATVSSHGSSISTLQSAMSTAQGDVATLKTQVRTGGGNLLTNTEALSLDGWVTNTSAQTGIGYTINGPVSGYVVPGVNSFCIYQPNTTSTGYAEYRQEIAIEALKWYDISGWYAAHRCTAQVYFQWVDASGASLTAPTGGVLPAITGGTALADWGSYAFKAQAPANAVRARILMRKWGTTSGSDSWAWFIRPQVAATTSGAAAGVAYSPGTERATITQTFTSLNGLFARWGVELDVNGYGSGFVLNNSGARSDALWDVDRFAIGKWGATTSYPFEVSGGVTYLAKAKIKDADIDNAKIANLAVGTLKIANNAVSAFSYSESTSEVTLPNATKQIVLQHTFTKAEAGSLLRYNVQVGMFGTDAIRGSYAMEVVQTDGTTIVASKVIGILLDGNNTTQLPVTFTVQFSGISTGTYIARVSFTASDSGQKTSGLRYLEVEEVKK